MNNRTEDVWSLRNFWGIIEVPRLEKDAQYIFLPQEGPWVKLGAVFPFALPDNDPDSMRVLDCVRIGCLGNPNAEDVKLLLSNSTIRLISLEGEDGQERKLQHEAPALTFPALFTLDGSGVRSGPLEAPTRKVLTPDYSDLNIYLTIHEEGDLSAPLTVCIMIDAYVPGPSLQSQMDSTMFAAHLDICEHDIKVIDDDPSAIEPKDVKLLCRSSSITVISVDGGNPRMLRARMDSLFVNLKMANALGCHTPDQKERYRNAKSLFFALQKEHRIFYLDDHL